MTTISHYPPAEERANVLTHGLGAVVAFAAGLAMVWLAVQRGASAWAWGSAIVFWLSMCALYLASAAYHRAADPIRRARLKVVDHCAIYLLIAGTYTPFTLNALHGSTGWTLFAAIWALATAGVIFKLRYTGRFRLVSTLIYIAMGWLVITVIGPVKAALTLDTLRWLIAGGIAYTSGTVFYMWKKLPYSHAIWHGFVVLGTLCHFIAVWQLLVPKA